MSYESFASSLDEPALIAVAAHWHSVRGGHAMPAWRDIDPAAIRQHLPIVWAWRYDAAEATFIGRLAGERIIAVLGLSTRGKPLEQCFRPGDGELVLERYKAVMNGPLLMHSYGNVFMHSGGNGRGERVVLPLAEDRAHGDGVFGATVYRLGRSPSPLEKFSIDHESEVIDFFPLA